MTLEQKTNQQPTNSGVLNKNQRLQLKSLELRKQPKQAVNIITSWWFQIFLIFSPILGEMIQFDLRIFFKWVGSTTKP